MDFTKLNWELIPPLSTIFVSVPAGLLLLSKLSLTRLARVPLGVADTVSVLV